MAACIDVAVVFLRLMKAVDNREDPFAPPRKTGPPAEVCRRPIACSGGTFPVAIQLYDTVRDVGVPQKSIRNRRDMPAISGGREGAIQTIVH